MIIYDIDYIVIKNGETHLFNSRMYKYYCTWSLYINGSVDIITFFENKNVPKRSNYIRLTSHDSFSYSIPF